MNKKNNIKNVGMITKKLDINNYSWMIQKFLEDIENPNLSVSFSERLFIKDETNFLIEIIYNISSTQIPLDISWINNIIVEYIEPSDDKIDLKEVIELYPNIGEDINSVINLISSLIQTSLPDIHYLIKRSLDE